MFRNDIADSFDKGGRVEFSTNDLVGAIGLDGDAPVADEGDELLRLSGLDYGTKVFGILYGGLSFDIDQYQVIFFALKQGERLCVIQSGIDFET